MAEDKELEKIKKELMAKMLRPPDDSPWKDGSILELSDSNFSEVIQKARHPVLVDFWASWCSPCKMMAPIFDAMAKEYSGRAYFGKVNVDLNQLTAQKFRVMSIPNFIIFKDGRVVERVVGAVGRTVLDIALRKHLY
jgi:thioredoxin 1